MKIKITKVKNGLSIIIYRKIYEEHFIGLDIGAVAS